ncbi:MAG: UDP-N-acetylmuramoyl-L-alanine--D-glutamate ligase [Pegethrix bostrychoides GSE-TBD4-15B]|jgi:UDP-N-acetylmuramoylalanine--D-glutamate ligase|uniref:UDP-N-acetylmuramoylalanine--D-glutamate ligase n=1 Tax=Pegethrix bostrychoides GSE-TBD4-15B TaxID=2839662 RepID=A0A951P7X0_9CYAN|nr:UDP-N-acetylmuramoyl-L-alanine--D-glutamate ligase [Pegethrix bostrychoides GSE-TBD4-15B]
MPSAYVIGLGRSGVAAARLLQRQGWQVTVSDAGTAPALQPLQHMLNAEGIAVRLGDRFTPDPDLMQLVVVSPGVPWDLPALVKARELGLETIGEVELAWQSLLQIPWVSVTGTNGKTTTTALIAAIFQAAGLTAPACGNIGYAVGEVALQALSQPPDWVIAELSSYQIESSVTVAPRIGVWTTFSADHLSRHQTLENYSAIKAKLLSSSALQVLNGDDPYLRQMAQTWPKAYWTSVTGKADLLCAPERGAYIENGWAIVQGEPILQVADLRMIGSHNQQNLLMAVLTARLAGIAQSAIVEAIRQFPGMPHRLELVCTWRGIAFINDSKATNYDAAQVGLAAVAAPTILIAGGEAKAGDDTLWMQTIRERAAVVLLIGRAAPGFAQRFEQIGQPSEIVETMEQAVRRGADLAEQLGAQNVLLSPACASFDQYSDFEQRGEHFSQLCRQILSD